MKSIMALLILLLTVYAGNSHGAAPDGKGGDPYRAGIAALKNGDTGSAIALLTEAIQQDSSNYRYYNDRGVAYKRAGNLEAALSDYAKALELNPGYENALNNRGVAYIALGRLDEAIADLTKAMKSETLKARVSNNLGIAYAGKGDHREAVTQFSRAISFGSTDHRSYLFLAESLRRMGSLDKALKVYHLALGLNEDPEVRKQIERGIAGLKQDLRGTQSPGPQSSPGTEIQPETGSADQRGSRPEPRGRPSTVRSIVRAGSESEGSRQSAVTDESQDTTEISSIEELDDQVRRRAIGKLSSVSAEIYAQGREFLEKSDTAKALVRFEDTRQLERRKQSHYGVAWSDLEIGRAYSALGQHHGATPYLEESVLFFERLGAKSEAILAMTELARNQSVTRGKSDSAASFRKAIEMAVSSGHYSLARAIDDASAGKRERPRKTIEKADVSVQGSEATASGAKPLERGGGETRATAQEQKSSRAVTKKPVGPSPGSGVTAEDKNKGALRAKEADSPRLSLEKVGTGTNWYVRLGDRAGKSRKTSATGDPAVSSSRKTKKSQSEPQPKRVVFQAKSAMPTPARDSSKKSKTLGRLSAKTDLQKDLDNLRKLKGQQDERKMIVVLERLSQRYLKVNDYSRALHCLDAAIGFRDDLRFTKGLSEALEQRGLVKEKLGRSAEGLEDFSRALAFGAARVPSEMKSLRAGMQKSASQIGLDPKTVLQAFDSLWTARKEADGIGETRALFQLGTIYEQSGRNQDALNYYKRASASMLADSAVLHAKMGRTELAGKLYLQAMEALKEIDYSRFIDLKHKSRVSNTISRQ
ncbi:MAG: tetratricopeptide repeat protein [Desulfomonilaceae bacterium]|nr:tetratricopeptide repeat protein [Desulfomonilaceae bacterium]